MELKLRKLHCSSQTPSPVMPALGGVTNRFMSSRPTCWWPHPLLLLSRRSLAITELHWTQVFLRWPVEVAYQITPSAKIWYLMAHDHMTKKKNKRDRIALLLRCFPLLPEQRNEIFKLFIRWYWLRVCFVFVCKPKSIWKKKFLWKQLLCVCCDYGSWIGIRNESSIWKTVVHTLQGVWMYADFVSLWHLHPVPELWLHYLCIW